jgi:hypothetical protein
MGTNRSKARAGTQGKIRAKDAGIVLPTVAAVEAAIGIPAPEWAGRCHEIARAMLAAKLVAGVDRYGHYYGVVAPAHPYAGMPVHQHGWIETPGGLVVDPTRWAFELVEPYIYCGPGDEYDPGGQRWAASLISPYPAGPHDEAAESPDLTPEQRARVRAIVQLDVRGTARDRLAKLTGGQTADFTIEQVFWLANLPVSWWGRDAPAIYEALAAAGHKATIPVDYWSMAMDQPMASHRP